LGVEQSKADLGPQGDMMDEAVLERIQKNLKKCAEPRAKKVPGAVYERDVRLLLAEIGRLESADPLAEAQRQLQARLGKKPSCPGCNGTSWGRWPGMNCPGCNGTGGMA